MKHLKHFLLMAAMLLCSIGASAETVEIDGIWYNLVSKAKQAEVARSGGTNYSGSITIPSSFTYEGVEYSVTSIGYGAFRDCSRLTSITLPEGVTSIGGYAFFGCSRLTSITLPEGVTSIGNSAFSGCISLTSITIPESVTSIEIAAFKGCSNLTSITLPEGVTSIGNSAFSGCISLTSITLPESVTSIGIAAFSGCISLTSITIPEGVTSIGEEAFYKCSSLTSITIPESVTSIGVDAFSDCSSLTDIHIASIELWLAIDYVNYYSHPNYVASDVKLYIGDEEVTEVVVPSSIKSIPSYAFYNCSSLTSITIPESVTNIRYSAFKGCRSLTSITLPENSQLTSIGDYAFSSCSSLTSITLPEGVKSIGNNVFYRCSSLTSINIPKNVTSIGNNAFSSCSSLTSIVLPKSVSSIDGRALANCLELTDVYCNAEKVPSTSTDAFDGSYIEYATLHVPASAVASYKTTAPWSSFGTIVSLDAAITRITLSASSATLTEGESLTLTLTTTPEDADRNLISWSSSNPSIATVDNTGKVTAIAPGTAIITATANDDSGVSASCEVTVTPASYIITFLVDGEVYATETLSRGATISVPDAPTKEGHTFSGWSGLPEIMPAKDITVSATFTVNKYQVTFKIDGVVIATYTQDYGSAIVAPEAPEREGYTFSGWGNVAETVPASDVTYEGSYSVNSYTVTYLVDGEVVHSESVNYGAAIVAPEEPTKEGHTFSGWSGLPETMPAKDITVSATFTVNKYQVTFKIDGVVIATYTQDYGSAIVVPDAPEREGYTFSGWGDVAETVPASDVTYEGSYTANLYNVYYFVGATLVHSVKVAYGEPIPEYIYEPEEEGYTFLGWIGETYATMPAHDVTYTANIDNGIGTLTIDYSQLNIYDLTGRKVTDTVNLKGGIYIINGKKVVIK